jgi:hypothetical protein
VAVLVVAGTLIAPLAGRGKTPPESSPAARSAEKSVRVPAEPTGRTPPPAARAWPPDPRKEMEKLFTPEELAKMQKEREERYLEFPNEQNLNAVCEMPRGYECLLRFIKRLEDAAENEKDFTAPVYAKRAVARSMELEEYLMRLGGYGGKHIPDSLLTSYANMVYGMHRHENDIRGICYFLKSRGKKARDCVPILKEAYLKAGSELLKTEIAETIEALNRD